MLGSAFAVYEYVDVPPDLPPLVDYPAAQLRMLTLEAADQLDHAGSLELELGAISSQFPQGPVEADDRHAWMLRRRAVSKFIARGPLSGGANRRGYPWLTSRAIVPQAAFELLNVSVWLAGMAP